MSLNGNYPVFAEPLDTVYSVVQLNYAVLFDEIQFCAIQGCFN